MPQPGGSRGARERGAERGRDVSGLDGGGAGRLSAGGMCTCVCMYACMYVCMDGWMDGWMDGCCMHVCMYVCLYLCMYVCMYVMVEPGVYRLVACVRMCLYVNVCMYMVVEPGVYRLVVCRQLGRQVGLGKCDSWYQKLIEYEIGQGCGGGRRG